MHLGECKHVRLRCQQLFCLFMSQYLEPSTAHSPSQASHRASEAHEAICQVSLVHMRAPTTQNRVWQGSCIMVARRCAVCRPSLQDLNKCRHRQGNARR